MSVATSDACVWRPLPTDGGWRRRRWATTWARILDHCADMNGAPLTRTPPRRSWGRGPSPPGWRRIQARRLTCLLLRAVQRRRVESLVLGALSSSPVHRALVLVLGTNIAVLLDCSKSSRQCSLPSLLTYLKPEHMNIVNKNTRRAYTYQSARLACDSTSPYLRPPTVREGGPSRRVQVVVRPVPGHSGLASSAGLARAHRST